MEMEENASDLAFPLSDKSGTHFKYRIVQNNGKNSSFPRTVIRENRSMRDI